MKANAIIGIMVNDSSRLPCLVYRHRQEPWLSRTDDPGGLGVGHYTRGEALLRIQPGGGPRDLFLSDLVPQGGARVLLAQASRSSDHKKRNEPVSPLRWRNWLFVCDGPCDLGNRRAEILSALPPFLRPGRGHGDAELLFHSFLARLHKNLLWDLQIRTEDLVFQLRKTAEKAGSKSNILVTNGSVLLAYRRSNPLSYTLFEGIDNCERCSLGPVSKRRTPRGRPHEHFRGICVTNRPFGEAAQWSEVPQDCFLLIEHSLKFKILNELDVGKEE